MSKNTLYVIGNGFDLRHEIKSSYCNFHEYIKNNYNEVEEFLCQYFDMTQNEDGFWADFENDLGGFDSMSLYDNYSCFSENDYCNKEYPQWSDFFGVEDELSEASNQNHEGIRESFYEWIGSLSFDNVLKRNLFFDNESLYLSFNYTLTLEDLYNIPLSQILHIHGDVGQGEHSLVFGHGKEYDTEPIPERDENGDSNRTPFTDAENSSHSLFYMFQKPVKEIIEKNTSFFSSINAIRKVIVLGHSLNDIDIPYFCKLNESVSSECIWYIVYYPDNENRNKDLSMCAMYKIGVDERRYRLLTWDEYENHTY